MCQVLYNVYRYVRIYTYPWNHHHTWDNEYFHQAQKFPRTCLFCQPPALADPPLRPQGTPGLPSAETMDYLPLLAFHVNGVRACIPFCLTSLIRPSCWNVLILSVLIARPFSLLSGVSSRGHTTAGLPPFTRWALGLFPTPNKAAMNSRVAVLATPFHFSWANPGRGTAGSGGRDALHFLRNCQADFRVTSPPAVSECRPLCSRASARDGRSFQRHRIFGDSSLWLEFAFP